MKTAIAVFCKTPGLSPVKTRLGAEVGRTCAEEFYRLSILALDEVLGQVDQELGNDVKIYWAVGEQEALKNPIWNSHETIWTGEGSLGERIHHIYEVLWKSNDAVIVIGSDSPQITAEYIITAIRQMFLTDAVIGPCHDGGFVLFGTKRLVGKSIWVKVKYSCEDTLSQLTNLLEQSNYSYHFISSLGDVDQYDDLISLLNDFLQMGSIIQPRQLYLFQWIQRLHISKMLMQEKQSVCFHMHCVSESIK
jgi:uncharacterized protein